MESQAGSSSSSLEIINKKKIRRQVCCLVVARGVCVEEEEELDSAMKDQHLTIHWPLIGMSLDDARRYGCRCPRHEDVMKAETYLHAPQPPPPSS